MTEPLAQTQKETEELRELKQRLNLALESGEVGVWDWNLETERCWRSFKHDQIFGYTEPVENWNFDIFLSHVIPEDQHIAIAKFRRPTNGGHINFECRILLPDETTHWIAIRGETLTNDDGKATRMLGTIVDITIRKQQAEMQCVAAVLAERDNFITMLTHDMKNPLIGANSLLEMLSTGQLGEINPEHREILDGLHRSNESLLNLVRDLADFYRLDKDIESLILEETHLSALLQESITRMDSLIRSRGVTVNATFEPTTKTVSIDRTKIERLLQNLLDNAVKFVDREGAVNVRLSSENAFAVVEVENNGPLIPPAELANLFRKFSQGTVGKSHLGGSGLGLYVCKQIAEAHGGSIDCRSNPDELTIFRVKLPYSAAM